MGSSIAPHGAALLVLSLTSLAIGYYAGRLSTTLHQEANDQFEEDDDESTDGDLGSIKAGLLEPCKLVLIVRTDLKMTPGRKNLRPVSTAKALPLTPTVSLSQIHATLACYKTLMKRNAQLVRHWERTGQAKIALKGTSEKQLLELEAMAKKLNLCARSVKDAGRTQVEPGTRTVLAIGPAPVELINRVTGKLRLL
ncbi:Peptidyl-trna hydrolase 2 [Mycena sanguinolenta]|uniref:peptidyl-tRNA hydrolase n=1 Tax=Mycena sanguinolenta TaxID=230812 RepID=A0A8H7CJD0_9AGAR|nr:Peptidyl-trna hydrolase 2 [Mycena sanguinolenta]